MDEELKLHLTAMEDRLTAMEGRLSGRIDSVVTLVENVSASLERELMPIREALQRIEVRMDRQGGIIQGGSRQIARLVSWSEDIDRLLAERDQKIEDLARRLAELEKRLPPSAAA